jgi:D-3-phosphoglycerate dehydrogenase
VKYVVVVADRIAESGYQLLRGEPSLDLVSTAGQPDRLPAALEGAHALIVRSETTVTDDVMALAPELRVIARAGAGVDNVDLAAATRRGIVVLNAPGANTVSAAEHTIALLLGLQRRIPWAAASMREGKWDRKAFPGSELRGKTIGVVGLGRIGQHVAQIARAFGMQVVAHDPYLPETVARGLGAELLKIDELLTRADVVTLHLPLTEETAGLINARRLALLRPTAVIVNAARGGLIDVDALADAIEAEQLAGAALDVFDPEPLPADSRLRSLDRVLLTPHLAASTSEAQDRVAHEICVAVRNALVSGSVVGAVNLPGINGKVLQRLSSVLELARRVGCLAAGIAHGRTQSVEVAYGGSDDEAPKPVMLAALEGVLMAIGVGPVSLVNAATLASDRGMAVARRVGNPVAGFETTVGVTVDTGDRRTTVVGTLIGDRFGRVIRVDDFVVDIPIDGHVLILRNRDVPGVIGHVGTILGEADVNIASYHQSRPDANTPEALAAIVVDSVPTPALVRELADVDDVLEVRVADLTGRRRFIEEQVAVAP